MADVATSPAQVRRVLASGGLLACLALLGVPLGSPGASLILCLLLLVVGLPHGALDLEQLRAAARATRGDFARIALVYLGLAGLALAVWEGSPALAMGLFLLIAAAHFSEDWRAFGEPLLGLAMASAMLAAPALLHRAQLARIFGQVTGSDAGGTLAELLLLIAPVTILMAAVGIADLLRRGRRREATVAAVLLAGMVLLPPLAGFALFFCAYHSPLHLRETWRGLALPRSVLVRISLALTGLALLGTGVLVAVEWRGSLGPSVTAATFATFAILTVPHMLAPLLLRGRRERA